MSTGPTVPEQMRAEGEAWRKDAARRVSRTTRVQACFAGASLILVAATVLLRLRLIEPRAAGAAFGSAARLTRRGVRAWRAGRPREGKVKHTNREQGT